MIRVRWRRGLRLLRTTAFRLALGYALAYSAVTGLVLGGVYWASKHYLLQLVDAELASARDVFDRLIRAEDGDDLKKLFSDSKRHVSGIQLFLLIDKHKHPVAGTLLGWPKGVPLHAGYVTFPATSPAIPPVDHPNDPDDPRARGLVSRLPGGHGWLLVVRLLNETDAYTDTIQMLLSIALGLISLLAIGGGVLMGRDVLKRIDAVRETAAEIMAGELDQRIPVAGRRDEFAELAEHLNAMLARIEALIHGMRAVTDNVAHDLRSPLNRLRSRLEVALLESRTPEEYRQVLEAAVEELEGVVKTFNALLSIAQAESGVRREHLADVDLSALALDLAELYGASAEEAGLELVTQVEPGVRVRGQRELLAQALSNLLDNAIKYSPTGGSIVLSVVRDAVATRLRVCDCGPGIPQESRERVLERFARLDAARSTPGNGLGLALVKAVAQLHGARLELSDARPGLCVELAFMSVETGASPESERRGPREELPHYKT